MKVVISSFGSSGDFNPCLGLGRALRQKGVDVLFLSNPYYAKKITEAGLRFFPAGEYFDVFREVADNPAYLHPRKGPKAVWNLIVRTTPEMYHAMDALIELERPDLIACHPLEYGGMTAAMHRNVPYATLSPGPMCWFHATDQAGYMNFAEWPRWSRRCQARIMGVLMMAAFRFSFKPFCRKQGIPPLIDSMEAQFGKARFNFGFWSPLLRPAGTDDPPNSFICGFVRDEHVKDWPEVPAETTALFDGPQRPVVVGLGSAASLHGETVYRASVTACRTLGRRCLLVGKGLERYADPENRILTADFAPYGWVFPRAGMVIHHGGVNTTAEAIRAGVPALIIPHAYDQFDNAIRTQKMGVARRLKTSQVNADSLTQTIRAIFDDPSMLEKARQVGRQFQSAPDGGETAALQIRDYLSR